MSMTDWAEYEVKLACKKENPDWDGESFDYGCSCYQSALKAYKSIMEDDHSGFSYSITKNILKRLLDELPLGYMKGDYRVVYRNINNRQKIKIFLLGFFSGMAFTIILMNIL